MLTGHILKKKRTESQIEQIQIVMQRELEQSFSLKLETMKQVHEVLTTKTEMEPAQKCERLIDLGSQLHELATEAQDKKLTEISVKAFYERNLTQFSCMQLANRVMVQNQAKPNYDQRIEEAIKNKTKLSELVNMGAPSIARAVSTPVTPAALPIHEDESEEMSSLPQDSTLENATTQFSHQMRAGAFKKISPSGDVERIRKLSSTYKLALQLQSSVETSQFD
jgi:hypothetical protein